MRPLFCAAAALFTLLPAGLARAQSAPAPTTPAVVVMGAVTAPPAGPVAPTEVDTPSRSVALTAVLEVVSPLGAAGCFYRGRTVAGALVSAGALISGGTLLYSLANSDKDAAIINAVAYGVVRLIGIAAAVRSESPPAPAALPPAAFSADPAPRVAIAPPLPTSGTIAISYALSF